MSADPQPEGRASDSVVPGFGETFRICRRPPSRGCPSTCGRCTTSPRPGTTPSPARRWPPRPGSTRPSCARTCPTSAPTAPAASATTSTVLVGQIESVLGLTQRRAVALVGVGNLGHALAGYGGFASRGFRIAALLDADPAPGGRTDQRSDACVTSTSLIRWSRGASHQHRGDRHPRTRRPGRRRPAGRGGRDQHPELRALRARRARRRGRPQGRPRGRAADPVLPRAPQGVRAGPTARP